MVYVEQLVVCREKVGGHDVDIIIKLWCLWAYGTDVRGSVVGFSG